MPRMRTILLALLVALAAVSLVAQSVPPASAEGIRSPDPRTIIGEPQGAPLSGEQLHERTAEVSALLRCPTCQGLSVNDSPSTLARNMKKQVETLLAQGYTRDQVLVYFEKSYGEFVRLEPPLRGVNWMVWLAPLLVLIIGGVIVRVVLQKMTGPAPQPETGAPAPERDTLPDDPSLAHYVRRVRQLAYGWEGGVPPAADTQGDHS